MAVTSTYTVSGMTCSHCVQAVTGELSSLPGVADVRGMGLLLAAELAEGVDSKAVQAACLERGLVVNAVTPTALRFAPPLTVSDDELDEAIAILTAALTSVLDAADGASEGSS
jgi:4-aminobutyrate aminotransferase-like enzyme